MLAVTSACRGTPEPVRAPGAPVVIVSIDTLRADRLSAYGYAGPNTPAIDALADDAVLFERAYSHVPLTLPSHASIFTGLLPPAHGVRNNKGYALEASHVTLAERLRDAGYATAGFASSMVLRDGTGIGQGFETWDAPGLADRPEASKLFAQRRGDVALDGALRWLDSRNDARPPLLFVHLFDPHTPYEAPEPYASRHADAYDAEVAWTDALVGRLVAGLKARGLYDSAFLVLLSDHGEGLGDHVEREHGVFLYRESLHVPLLLKLPGGARAGKRVSEPVGLTDVLPTVLALLGVDAGGLPGRDLLDPTPGADRVLYAESRFGLEQWGWSELRSAIQGSRHYIEAPRPELYDLESDPGERRNLLPKKAVPEDLAAAVRTPGAGERTAVAVSEEEAGRLAALGYLGGSSDAGEASERDPKDHIRPAMELMELLDDVGQGGSLQAEERAVELLVRLDVQREDLRRTLANNFLKTGRVAAAREVLAPLTESGEVETQLLLGEVAAAEGRVAEARTRFERALALDPESAAARRDMGILALSGGHVAEATRWLEDAVARAPGEAAAWNGLGVLRARGGDPRAAIDAWRHAVDADPELSDAWFNLAMTSRQVGDVAATRGALQRYAELVTGPDRDRALALLQQLGS